MPGRSFSGFLIALGVFAGAPAVAQDAQPAAATRSADASGGIEEIVVTARKREESAQDVPIAISAFGEESLRDAGVSGVTDLQRLVPNITVTETNGLISGAALTFIRGIGNDPGLAQGVGLYLDDVYLNRAVIAQLEVSDIERIEVLKGPQGHLYGRNTIGGAIRYITKDPGEELRAHAEIKAGRFGHFETKLSASGPIIEEKLGFSLAGMYRYRDGIQKNFDGEDFWGTNLQAYRGKLVFRPLETLRFKLAVDHVFDNSDPYIPKRAGIDAATVGFLGAFVSNANLIIPGAGVVPSMNDLSLDGNLDSVNTEFGSQYDRWNVKATTASVTIEWDATETITLKSVSAGRWGDRITPFDFDGSNQLFIHTVQEREEKDYTQELQVNYDGEGINAVAGAFYMDAWDDQPTQTEITARLTGGRRTQTDTRRLVNSLESWALYGNLDLSLGAWVDALEGLQISVGGRYTEDTISLDRISTNTFTDYPLVTCIPALGCTSAAVFVPLSATFRALAVNPASLAAITALPGIFQVTSGPPFNIPLCGLPPAPCAVPPGTPVAVNNDVDGNVAKDTSRDGAWNVRLSYAVTDDILVYTGAGSGYKQAGINAFQAGTFSFYRPEEVTTYVAGFKSTLLDGTLRVNAEGFFNDYQDKQLGVITLIGSQLVSSTENAGKVESYGIDLETTYVTPLEGLVVSLNVGWLEADFKEFLRFVDADAVTPGVQPVQIDVADDNRLGYSPRWTVQPRLVYDISLGSYGSLTFATDVAYRTRSYTDSPMPLVNTGAGLVRTPDVLTPSRIQKKHALWGAGLTYRTPDEHWRLGIEVRNITDERVQVNSFEVGPIVAAGYTLPRTWALTASYDF